MIATRDRPHALATAGVLLILAATAGCRSRGPERENRSILGHRRGESVRPEQAADVQFALGRAAEKRGDLDTAQAAYTAATLRDPTRADALHRLAVVHDRKGEPLAAGPLYQRALKAGPGNPDLFCDRGYSLYLQGRYPEAERDLRQALAVEPKHARARVNLGLVLGRTGRDDEALASFIGGGCSAAEAQANLAFALALDRKFDAARDRYQLALAADGSSEAARSGLAQVEALAAKADAGAGSTGDPAVRPAGLKREATAARRPDQSWKFNR